MCPACLLLAALVGSLIDMSAQVDAVSHWGSRCLLEQCQGNPEERRGINNWGRGVQTVILKSAMRVE